MNFFAFWTGTYQRAQVLAPITTRKLDQFRCALYTAALVKKREINMKEGIHPKYNPQSKFSCASCGTVTVAGSVLADTSITVCSTCHPFYTGQQRTSDTQGRIQKFQAKYAKTAKAAEAAKSA